jgi:CBS domain containing-hemolysin-like protein
MIATMSYSAMLFYLCLCAVFVFLSGLFSGSETGLYCVDRLRLRLAAHEKDRSAVRLQGLLEDEPGLLFTTLLGTNIANYLAPVCLTIIFLSTSAAQSDSEREHLAEFYTTLILTPVVFIFGEVVPKNVFQRHADRFMVRMSSFLGATHQVFRLTGIIAFQRKVSEVAMKRLHRRPVSGSALHSRPGMYHLLREGAAAGALTHTQVFMLERIHALQSIRVGSVMVPRSRTIMLSAEATWADVERTIRNTQVSRMPVYRDGDRRRIVGTVHLLDLLTADSHARWCENPFSHPSPCELSRHLRPPVELPPDLPVIEALSALQREHRRMAIVVDKWGHCIGIVTVKDLVEEIVGELAAW